MRLCLQFSSFRCARLDSEGKQMLFLLLPQGSWDHPMKNEAHDGVVTGRARRLILPLALAALLGGYNGCLAQVPGPGAVKAPPQPPPATASDSSAASSEYIIGPGDTLKITVLRNPELNAEVPVRPDGKISTPLVNDAVAVGKTPTQLAQEMEKVIGEYVRAPTVSVIVTHPVSTFSQVEVGGLSQFAAGNRAKIVRTEGQSTREIRVRLSDLLNKGKISENVPLRPGDILVIPET